MKLQRSRARASAERYACAIDSSCPTGLQRSRARASAERCDVASARRPKKSASTEPRSCERGEGIRRRRIHNVGHASTEPRSCERGECFTKADHFSGAMLQRSRARASAESFKVVAIQLLPRSFNGAALVRARRVAGEELRSSGSRSFNGAALVRARRETFSSTTTTATAGFNGAALVRARRECHRRVVLTVATASTEPRSCERGEIHRWYVAEWCEVMLQRSRARASAERAAGASHGSTAMGFNGAALVRARRGPLSAITIVDGGRLQRSRARASAESSVRSCICAASIELQRSRARASAERPPFQVAEEFSLGGGVASGTSPHAFMTDGNQEVSLQTIE